MRLFSRICGSMDAHREDRLKRQRRFLWAAAAVLTAVTFSPLVIPEERMEPRLFHMPYALWMGIVVAALWVGLTAAATRLYGEDEPDRKGDGP